MPTGYTAPIAEGAISFEQFALRCARAFGPLVRLREEDLDTPLPDSIEPFPYHAQGIGIARERVAMFETFTAEQADSFAREAYQERVTQRQTRLAAIERLTQHYTDMLERVRTWTPPTPDHQGLKDFMVQQITESRRADCMDYEGHDPEPETGQEWLTRNLKQAREELDYHIREHEKEVHRTQAATEWLRQLKASLK